MFIDSIPRPNLITKTKTKTVAFQSSPILLAQIAIAKKIQVPEVNVRSAQIQGFVDFNVLRKISGPEHPTIPYKSSWGNEVQESNH